MPATWLQYGVDALNAGYADPYNPVDAIFAAARYLRAAGAASNLHARDPRLQPLRGIRQLGAAARQADLRPTRSAVIATLTGLVDGRLPVTGKTARVERAADCDALALERRPPTPPR